jgi:hypothetical protein
MTLTQREKKLKRLREKLAKDKLNDRLTAKYNTLEAAQKNVLANMLHEENPAFRAHAEETASLMVNKHILFKVTREHSATHSTYTNALRGAVHNNGYLYLVNQSNTSLFSFWHQYISPQEFHGRINPLGLAELKVPDTSAALIGNRVPQQFSGCIEENGSIVLKVMESYWESKGNYFVKSILGDPFKGEEHKRSAFLTKRSVLYTEIATLRKKLLG